MSAPDCRCGEPSFARCAARHPVCANCTDNHADCKPRRRCQAADAARRRDYLPAAKPSRVVSWVIPGAAVATEDAL